MAVLTKTNKLRIIPQHWAEGEGPLSRAFAVDLRHGFLYLYISIYLVMSKFAHHSIILFYYPQCTPFLFFS